MIYLDPAKPANFSGQPKADLILITDIHGDHMDPDSIKEVSKAGTEILAPPPWSKPSPPPSPSPTEKPKPGRAGPSKPIPAYNLKRGPAPGKLFHDKGRGNGYVLTYGGKRFYFSGDTEGVPEMRALKNIDVAFVCMNLPYTMPPDEAADAVKAFHPKVVIPYHYRGSDLTVFQKGLEGTGIEVRLLDWYPKCWTLGNLLTQSVQIGVVGRAPVPESALASMRLREHHRSVPDSLQPCVFKSQKPFVQACRACPGYCMPFEPSSARKFGGIMN